MSPGSDCIKFKVIAAVCENMGIGIKGDIPWRLKEEMSYFQKMTTSTRNSAKKNAVIMGRKTWESIPPKYKPLAGRVNVVISNTVRYSGIHDVPICKSLEDAVSLLTASPYTDLVEDVWIIGGSALYQEAINSPLCEGIYLTRVEASFECDTFFPEIPSNYQEISLRRAVRTEYWCHPYIQRNMKSRLFIAAGKLNQTDSKFIAFYRMSKDCFLELVRMVAPAIKKMDTNMRECVTAQGTILITLRNENVPSEVQEEKGIKYRYTVLQRAC